MLTLLPPYASFSALGPLIADAVLMDCSLSSSSISNSTRSPDICSSSAIAKANGSRSSTGTVMAWPSGTKDLSKARSNCRRPQTDSLAGQEISIADLAMLLEGVDLSTAQRRQRYQRPQQTR